MRWGKGEISRVLFSPGFFYFYRVPTIWQAILHAAKRPVTTRPRFCCSRETEGANNNDQPSLNRWHASLGGWLKCYFHFSFPNYLSNYFKFFRLSSSYEFSLTIDLSRITLQWANIKKWGRGSGGQFHTNHYILSTRASSWCLCLQECGKGLLVL